MVKNYSSEGRLPMKSLEVVISIFIRKHWRTWKPLTFLRPIRALSSRQTALPKLKTQANLDSWQRCAYLAQRLLELKNNKIWMVIWMNFWGAELDYLRVTVLGKILHFHRLYLWEPQKVCAVKILERPPHDSDRRTTWVILLKWSQNLIYNTGLLPLEKALRRTWANLGKGISSTPVAFSFPISLEASRHGGSYTMIPKTTDTSRLRSNWKITELSYSLKFYHNTSSGPT